ncbi:MAG: dual specificity protein phosphatase [Kangiellaceae bacterium]|jgi:protein-tyrosine phosphatase|nr:dual specificity protein phosphatase [Kangiellaceae bacterium]
MNIFHKVVDGLYIGNAYTSKNQRLLEKNQITHIVAVGTELKTWYPNTFKYMHIAVEDKSSEDLGAYFDACVEFMTNAIESCGRVYVHCLAGASRSSTI